MEYWESKEYLTNIVNAQETGALRCGMSGDDGLPVYDPFSTPNIDQYYFDFEEAQLYIDFIQDCYPLYQSSIGNDAWDYIKLLDYQTRVVSCLFGWKKKKDGLRRYYQCLIYIPRKNGKTGLLGGIALAFTALEKKLNAEAGIQVACAANTREQASITWLGAYHAVRKDENLKTYFNPFRNAITAQADTDTIKRLSNDAQVQDGLNVCLALVDEIHEFRNGDLAKVIKSSQSSRKQPLYLEITTAAAQGVNYCNSRLEYAQKVIKGTFQDDRFLPVLFYLNEKDDWEDKKSWYKVNPALGIIKSIEAMEGAYNEAKLHPGLYENEFKRKNLNIVTASVNKFLDSAQFNACLNPDFDVTQLMGAKCFAGLDMAYKDDMCSLVLEFPDFNNFLLPFFWIPREHRHIEAYDQFQTEITRTEGDVIDFAKVRKDIQDLADKYNIQQLAFDPRYATELTQKLSDSGIEIIEYNQKGAMISQALKDIQIGLKDGIFSHAGNNTLSWMVGNVEAEIKDDLVKVVKPTGQNRTINKIDGILAWAMAHALRVYSQTEDYSQDIKDRAKSGGIF